MKKKKSWKVAVFHAKSKTWTACKAKKTPNNRKHPPVYCFYCLERLARFTYGGAGEPQYLHWYKRTGFNTTSMSGYSCIAPIGDDRNRTPKVYGKIWTLPMVGYVPPFDI